MKNKIKNILIFIIILLSSIMIVGSIYYIREYPKQDFDVILYTLSAGVEKTSPDVINGIISKCIIPIILLLIISIMPTIQNIKNKKHLKFKFKGKTTSIQLFPIKITSNHRIIYTTLIFIIALITFIKCFSIDEYIINKIQVSKIFEEYYVDPREVNIEFPEDKRNLIIIIGESFENTVLSTNNGGAWEYSIMPELENLALNNSSFSNTEKIGGPYQTHGTDYSAGGNVAITAGIPLKTVDILSDKNVYTGSGNYLSGAYTLRRNTKR